MTLSTVWRNQGNHLHCFSARIPPTTKSGGIRELQTAFCASASAQRLSRCPQDPPVPPPSGLVLPGVFRRTSRGTVAPASISLRPSPDGQPLAGRLLDYAIPRADDMPMLHVATFETLSPTNPLSLKGVRELPTVACPVALVNTVVDALAGANVRNSTHRSLRKRSGVPCTGEYPDSCVYERRRAPQQVASP